MTSVLAAGLYEEPSAHARIKWCAIANEAGTRSSAAAIESRALRGILGVVAGGQYHKTDSCLKAHGQPTERLRGVEFLPVPGTTVLLGVWPVRIRDWLATGRPYDGPRSFRHESPDHPVGNISWYDAQAFCAWLSEREGRIHRLPTDHEWSCAVGIGHLENPAAEPACKDCRLTGVYPWGQSWPPPRGAGNYQGEEWHGNAAAYRALRHEYLHYYPDRTAAEIEQINDPVPCIAGFNDGYLFTSPVGSFTPNAHGFYDLGGNVNEWCQDRFSSSDRRILRGGSFGKLRPDQLLSSRRYHGDPTRRLASHGFRIAVDM